MTTTGTSYTYTLGIWGCVEVITVFPSFTFAMRLKDVELRYCLNQTFLPSSQFGWIYTHIGLWASADFLSLDSTTADCLS